MTDAEEKIAWAEEHLGVRLLPWQRTYMMALLGEGEAPVWWGARRSQWAVVKQVRTAIEREETK
jgi:hypothetical protein